METDSEKKTRLELLEKLKEARAVLDTIISDCENNTLEGTSTRIDRIREKLHQADNLSDAYFD